jgi:glutathione S-transferase
LQWLNFIRNESWPLAKTISAMVFGQIPMVDETEYIYIYNQLKENIKTLNNSLKNKQWLVGDQMTVADLLLTVCIVEL